MLVVSDRENRFRFSVRLRHPKSFLGRLTSAFDLDRYSNLCSMARSFVDQLLARSWVEEAACAEWPEDRLDEWFTQGTSGQSTQPGDASPTVLELMLTCSRCTVRRECLTEAVSRHPLGGMAVGVWGASTTAERHALRHLPPDQAVDVLEAGLAERVRRRVQAVAAKHPASALSARASFE
jgi:Transcription factor WhiB